MTGQVTVHCPRFLPTAAYLFEFSMLVGRYTTPPLKDQRGKISMLVVVDGLPLHVVVIASSKLPSLHLRTAFAPSPRLLHTPRVSMSRIIITLRSMACPPRCTA